MLRRIMLIIICILMLPSLTLAAKKSAPAAPPQEVPKPPVAQVMFDGKPLFTIRESVLTYAPKDRASMISARLAKLAESNQLQPDSITTVEIEEVTEIIIGEMLIMAVTDKDAAAEGKERQALVGELVLKMRTALKQQRDEYSARSIMFGMLYTLVATAVLAALLLLMTRFFPRLVARIETMKGSLIRTIRFQNLELLHEDRIATMIIRTAKVLRLIIILLLLYVYIPLVFSFFPWTRGFATTLFAFIREPLGKIGEALISYLPNIFFIVVIVVITNFAIKFCRFFFSNVGNKNISLPGFYPEWSDASFKIVRFLIVAVALVMAFPYLPGSGSSAFKGISVFLGVLFSLGSTSAVANVVAGVILTYMRPFRIGDRVKISDAMGDVTEKSLLVTRIKTIKNVEITIPNAMVLSSHIINYSTSAAEQGLILHTSVTIGYDAPWRTVHQLLTTAATATAHILPEPAPFVLQTALDDFYVRYELNAYTHQPSLMARIYSDLHQNIQDAFNEAGVEIMSPHYAQLRDGNRTTIPENYLPAAYEPDGFRVTRTER
jgi:small-conductance mechanosensitive channel